MREGTGPINTTIGAGKKIPTYPILRFYWSHRNSIRAFLHGIGFKEIKIPLFLLWDITIVTYTVLNVEFSLRMNNIDDIYDMWSAGQLFPVIIGAGGIGVAAAEIYVYQREKVLKVNWAKSVDITRIEHPVGWNSETAKTQASSQATDDKKTELNFEGAKQEEKLEPTSVDITAIRADAIRQ